MAELRYEKTEPVRLRDLGFNERWLQNRIEDDPSILGMGELSVIQRERPQPSGGRIDLLLSDLEQGIRYEVEVMLGRVDESHIIRTIEYWDIERQRYPNLQHRAVIVAEDLTSRFLNVIALMNRAIPIVAIQMSAFKIDDRVVLHFVKLLDLSVESLAEEEEIADPADRTYWESRASAASLGAADKLLGLIPGSPAPAYNKSHISVGNASRRFCFIHPRRRASHILLTVYVGNDARDDWVDRLEASGLNVQPGRMDSRLKINRLTQREIGENETLLKELLQHAEGQAR